MRWGPKASEKAKPLLTEVPEREKDRINDILLKKRARAQRKNPAKLENLQKNKLYLEESLAQRMEKLKLEEVDQEQRMRNYIDLLSKPS